MFNIQKVESLIQKYFVEKYKIKKILWYPDYPEKQYWSKDFSQEDFQDGLKQMYTQGSTLLYIHMPYCHTQCLFCTCKTIISLDYKNVQKYMDWLYKEIDLHANFLAQNQLTSNITDIHLGGGSPTYLNEQDFTTLVNRMKALVNFSKVSEFSMEIDPRRINPDRMHFYHASGINRISFGVQDFDPNVQKAVDRIQPDSLIRRLLTPDVRKLFPNGVNFDIMCGLPKQTRETFAHTIDKVVELSPDRISLLTMSITPEIAPHQLLMPLDTVPGTLERKVLLNDATEKLLANGYVQTGYEHFAKPEDSTVKAMKEGTMIWGGLGPVTGSYQSYLGLGTSSYSRLGPSHAAQNLYELADWEKMIDQGKFPILRGHVYSQDDNIRREVILHLRTQPHLDFKPIEEKYGIDFKKYFSPELAKLAELSDDGLLELNDSSLQLTPFGISFADFVTGFFDAYHKF